MRIEYMEVEGFRAFSERQAFDLDGTAIIVVGANGQGKTSFFDAIFWCLTGFIPRIAERHASKAGSGPADGTEGIISRYSRTGRARVELHLRGSDGGFLEIIRTADAGSQRLIVSKNKEGPAEVTSGTELVRLLWPDAAYTEDAQAAFVRALAGSVYLQQDRLRQFVDADSDADRFLAVSELVGAGRITELSATLSRERKQWSEALNVRKAEVERLKGAFDQARSNLAALGPPSKPVLDPEVWETWWHQWSEVTGEDRRVDVDYLGAADALDSAVREIELAERRRTRRLQGLRDLQKSLRGRDAVPARSDLAMNVERLEALEEASRHELKNAEAALQEARERESRHLESLVERQQRREQMQALATLARKLLDATCPVCGQSIDLAATEARLRRLMEDNSDATEPTPHGAGVEEALVVRGEAESRHNEAVRALREGRALLSAFEERKAEILNELSGFGIDHRQEEDAALVVSAEIEEERASIEKLRELREEGEQLSTAHARRAQEASRREAEARLEKMERGLTEAQIDVQERANTGKIASRILKSLRHAESEYVGRRLDEMAPVLRRVYARMDPHPAFRDVALLASTYYGKGRLSAAVMDHARGVVVEDPELILSSSQVNVLALSVFLSLNLGVPRLPVNAILLDDPVQSLDDVNLLGLADLLRRLRDLRQVIVSTHDEHLGRLLARKLRPSEPGHRTRVIRLEGWSREGPLVRGDDVSAGPTGLRVVA